MTATSNGGQASIGRKRSPDQPGKQHHDAATTKVHLLLQRL